MSSPQPISAWTGTVTIDAALGCAGPGGGIPDEGIYRACPITAVGYMAATGNNPPSLTVNVGGIGARDQFAYVSIPQDPNHKHYKFHQQLMNQFLGACGVLPPGYTQAYHLNAQVAAGIVGKQADVYFIPPALTESGQIIDGSKQEMTFLNLGEADKIESGEIRAPKRRMKVALQAAPGSIGTQLPGALPGLGAAPGGPLIAPVSNIPAPGTQVAPPPAQPGVIGGGGLGLMPPPAVNPGLASALGGLPTAPF